MSDRPNLREVLEHYNVELRDRANQMVSCPFHEDRTPSCSVNLNKGLWNCKSCGKGGDSFNLIMEMEGVNFVGARAFASSVGIPTGDAGGGGADVSGDSYTGRRKVSPRKKDLRGGSRYVPAWRRV